MIGTAATARPVNQRRPALQLFTVPRSGFTYIELMVAVAIMAVLALSAMPLSDWLRQRAQESELRNALRQIRTAIDAYRRAADEGLIAKAEGASGYPRSLADLVRGAEKSEGAVGARPGATTEAPARTNADPPAAAEPMTAGTGGRPGRLYFLRRVPRDPFFPDARVPAELTWGLRSSESPPDRPAPGKDVFDVYSLSPRRAIDGSYYRTW